MFPRSDMHRELVANLVPTAKATYYDVFAGHTAFE
jgi:hypothetical protein